jgi:mono/diheme cytochrome c family protein
MITTIKKLVLVGVAVVFLGACNNDPKHPGYEFMPDMYRSPSYGTHSENPVFKDGATTQTPPEGTIPRGHEPYPYPNNTDGYIAAGLELENPLALTPEILEEGKVLYGDFCSTCHGEDGKGSGKLVQLDKFPPPPSFSNQLKGLEEGKMFHSITYGKGLMGSHAHQVETIDRWKIIHYIKEKLQ